MSQWPIIVRELVFPQIYGFFPEAKLSSSLKKLYSHEVKSSNILDENFEISQ